MSSVYDKIRRGQGDFAIQTRYRDGTTGIDTGVIPAKAGKLVVVTGIFASCAGTALANNTFRVYWHDGSSEAGEILGTNTEPISIGTASTLNVAPRIAPIARGAGDNYRVDVQVLSIDTNAEISITVSAFYWPKNR